MVQGKAGSAAPFDATLTKDIQTRRTELLQREKLLQELQRGLFKPGSGHAARLELLAQTIPAQVWVTEVKADESQLDVSGFTLEPAALSVWVAKLAASPLLEGQKLATVKVENATPATVSAAGAAAAASSASSAAAPAPRPPVWSFNLVSAVAKSAPDAGGKP